jgi:hypothetical protein
MWASPGEVAVRCAVMDGDLTVRAEADAFLRHVRIGRDGSELTIRSYAGGIALFRVCSFVSIGVLISQHPGFSDPSRRIQR